MEVSGINQCVQNTYVNGVKNTSAPNAADNSIFTGVTAPVGDTVSVRSKENVYMDKLNRLFPNGGFDKLCDQINKDFGIDKPAKVKLHGDNDGVTGGGYNFDKNEIDLSLSDLLGSDTKIVGIKDGKKITLVSPKEKLPLFVDKESADKFLQYQAQHGNLGFDKLVAEPVTEKDQRKFITQKVSHEIIHAQQHMVMRMTEDINEKDIVKAWTHDKPTNLIESFLSNLKTDKEYNNSYWKEQPATEKKISKDSAAGKLAHIWLESVRNYPPVTSPLYSQNPIEKDAYERSAQYANAKFGAWS